MVREMDASPYTDLCAVADVDPDARERFHNVFPGPRVYDSVEQLGADPEVEAVWLATPNRLHCEHAVILANAGKHVMVQKPMAITLEEAQTMIDAADSNNVQLLAGPLAKLLHSHPQDAAHRGLRRARTAVRDQRHRVQRLAAQPAQVRGPGACRGGWGGVSQYSAPDRLYPADWWRYAAVPAWHVRPMATGPAVARLQRRLHGVRGWHSGGRDPELPAISSPTSLCLWGSDHPRQRQALQRGATRKAFRDGTRNEMADYEKMGIGKSADFGANDFEGSWMGSWLAGDLGIMLVSCERGDIRQSPQGLYVYTDDGIREIQLPKGASPSTWEMQLRELYDVAVRGGKAFHSGRWGMGTLEVTLAIMESARTRQDVELKHQIEMDEE
jgi:phthalate 4,5-cis-dihydrodiol dehydrogenase